MRIANLLELALSLGLECWLIILLFRRDVRRHFPIFFGYTLCTALATVARLLSARHDAAYFYIFWWSEALLLLLSLAALDEVFRWVFEGFHRRWQFRLLYYGTIAALLIITIRNAIVNPPVQTSRLTSLILNTGIAVDLVQAGIVGLFYTLAKLLDVEFRRYAFGIAVGFGASAVGPVIGYLARYEFGTGLDNFFRKTAAVSYILALGLWVTAFIRPEPEEKEWKPPMPPDQMLKEVNSYLKALGISRKKK
jgi:hypothetical protein